MRKVIIGSSLLVLALTLTGCQGVQTNPDAEPSLTQSKARELSSIEVWAGEDLLESLAAAAKQFQADYGVSVTVTQKGFFDIRDEIETGLNPPDLFAGSSTWVRSLQDKGLIYPVQSEPALKFQAPSLRSFGYQGKQFGYPYAAENIALICNSNQVPNQPTDWSQVATKEAPLPVLENGDPYYLYALQASFGASVFLQDELGDDLAKLNFGGPGGSAFANWLGENRSSFKLQSSQAAVNSFLNNEANCLLGGPWLIPQLGDTLPLAIYDVPALGENPATSFLTTRGFFITQASSAKETAELFLSEYLASGEFQKLVYLTSGQQPVTEAFLGEIDSSTTRGFIKAANTAVPLPTLEQLSQIWFEWGLAQVKIIQGASDPDLLWSEMARNLASRLGLE